MADPFLGEIRMVGFTFAPRGWAFCAGQLLALAQNQALFALLGTTYGGNGQTTFGLPNLGGRVPVGTGQSPGATNVILGEIAGTNNTTLTTSQMPTHNHSIIVSGGGTLASTEPGTAHTPASGSYLAASDQRNRQFASSGSATLAAAPITANAAMSGGSQPLSIMQPYLGINFIIALEGIFPSRN